MRKHAPIIIFAFNRLETLKRCVTSLQKNTEAKDSDLFVFVDGVRPNIQGEQEKIKSVREYVKTITGFRSLHYDFAKENQGLGNSIISGRSRALLPSSPLRTVHESFPSYGSSFSKPLFVCRDRLKLLLVSI